jgi:hypothetical protein
VYALRQYVLSREAQIDPGDVPDARLWYTAADTRDYLDQIGPRGRCLYAVTLLTLDLLMPVLYGGLLGCLIARLCSAGFGRRWVWVPVGAATADLGENLLLADLAATFDGGTSRWTWVAACLTAAKWILSAAAVLGLILGALWRAVIRRSMS